MEEVYAFLMWASSTEDLFRILKRRKVLSTSRNEMGSLLTEYSIIPYTNTLLLLKGKCFGRINFLFLYSHLNVI